MLGLVIYVNNEGSHKFSKITITTASKSEMGGLGARAQRLNGELVDGCKVAGWLRKIEKQYIEISRSNGAWKTDPAWQYIMRFTCGEI